MAPYIFTQRNGIHIIDLQQTIRNLHQFHDMIVKMVADGGTVLVCRYKTPSTRDPLPVKRVVATCPMSIIVGWVEH